MSKKGGIILPLLLIGLLILVFYKLNTITDFIVDKIEPMPKVIIANANEYSLNKNHQYVTKTEDFVPYSKHDLMNIFYTILDNGYDSFTFYCPNEYTECIEDITNIINNKTLITDIGNYVHPFNNFHLVELTITTGSIGEITLKINKTYTSDMIDEINKKVDSIFNEIFTDDMSIEDKILKAHDYIIEHTEYDTETNNTDLNAYDLFMHGKSKCFGYADAMAIILHRLGVENYKVGSSEHVWNAVLLNDKWSHIDVTWDDPVVNDNTNITNTIRHKFYMIDTATLLSYDTEEHNFNKNVYTDFQ